MRFDPAKISNLDSVEYFFPFSGDGSDGLMVGTQENAKGKFKKTKQTIKEDRIWIVWRYKNKKLDLQVRGDGKI